MKNITVDIYPDKWIVTITIGSKVSRREWEPTRNGAQEVAVTGDQFAPDTEAALSEALDEINAFEGLLALKKITE